MNGTKTWPIPYKDPLLSGRMTIRRSISFPLESLAMASWYRVFKTFSTCSGRALTGGRTGSGLNACRWKIIYIKVRKVKKAIKVVLYKNYHPRGVAHLSKFLTESTCQIVGNLPREVDANPVAHCTAIYHFLHTHPQPYHENRIIWKSARQTDG